MKPKRLIKSAGHGSNSVHLMDASRKNDSGEMYCVAPYLLPSQVDQEWQIYLKNIEQEKREILGRYLDKQVRIHSEMSG